MRLETRDIITDTHEWLFEVRRGCGMTTGLRFSGANATDSNNQAGTEGTTDCSTRWAANDGVPDLRRQFSLLHCRNMHRHSLHFDSALYSGSLRCLETIPLVLSLLCPP